MMFIIKHAGTFTYLADILFDNPDSVRVKLEIIDTEVVNESLPSKATTHLENLNRNPFNWFGYLN